MTDRLTNDRSDRNRGVLTHDYDLVVRTPYRSNRNKSDSFNLLLQELSVIAQIHSCLSRLITEFSLQLFLFILVRQP